MLTKIFPGLAWLQGYNRMTLRSDLLSGITIAAMLIPQSMGYAVLAGVPAEYGLYACIVPPLIYALLGTSNKISMGPVALDSILILSGLSVLAEPGSDNYLELAITLTLLVGVIQLFFGFIKFGFIANFLSHPVILGYTSAASIIIICSQLGSILGVSVTGGNTFIVLLEYSQEVGNWHWATLGVGIVGLLFLQLARMYSPTLPCGLILLLVGMGLSGLWDARGLGVDVIAAVPEGLPVPRVPRTSLEQIFSLLPTALTVALMGYVGSMSICKAQEKPSDKISAKPNQELIAMGAANLFGAFVKSFPVSASFSRSAAFVESGALTQVSAIVSSLVIVFVILFLTPVFTNYPLPTAILAAIIIVSVTGLFKYGQMKALYLQNKHEFVLMLATFLITLLSGVQYGLLMGVALSVARVIYNTATPHMTELGAIEGGRLFRNVNRFEDVAVRGDLLIFRFDAPLYFANKDYLVDKLYGWMNRRKNNSLRSIIFNAESVSSVDSSAILMLLNLVGNLQQQGIKLYITNAIGPVRDALANSAMAPYMRHDFMFPTIRDAIDHIDHGVSADAGVALQTGIQFS